MSNFSPYPEGSECDPNCPWNAVEDDFVDEDDICDGCGEVLNEFYLCPNCDGDEDSDDDEV